MKILKIKDDQMIQPTTTTKFGPIFRHACFFLLNYLKKRIRISALKRIVEACGKKGVRIFQGSSTS